MKKIVIFGECMVELVSANETQLTKSFAGDTYNTAVYLKRSAPQVAVSYLTAIGDDFLSNELLFAMGNEQISTEQVYRSSKRNLGLYMVRTDQHGERTFAYWRANSAATQTINAMTKAPEDIDFFYFSGISVAILDEPQRLKLFELLATLRNKGCKVVFDPNYRPLLWSSRDEARFWMNKSYQLADIAFPGGDDHLALYEHVNTDEVLAHLAPFEIDEVVMKNGAVGVHIVNSDGHFIVPVQQVANVVDTTAAGDAFNGGYLAARLSGKSVTDAASYGAIVAGTVIQHPGAIIPADTLHKAVAPL
ncbi:sugar kinase [Alteromonas gilva]|uniref:sugar kinase n=1 Tax=Alteromonas gilva TaxID=2987522 RepID=UPI0035AB897A